MTTRLRIGVMAMLVLMAAAAVVVESTERPSSPQQRAGVRRLGPLAPSEPVAFTLELRPRNAGRLEASLAAMADPRSAAFRHFVDPHMFGESFGISSGAITALERVVRLHGLRVTAAYPQRTELGVEGSALTVERLLHVRLLSHVDAVGHRYRAPLGMPLIPRDFRGVDGITGLDTRPRWRPHDVPLGGLTPAAAAAAYDIDRLRAAGIYGQGQTVAVISFSAFQPGDPPAYARRYGLSGPKPQVISVGGGTYDLTYQGEANLDIDVIRAIAPAARILFYETSSTYSKIINRIVSDHKAQVISSSWGDCEPAIDPSERRADAHALASGFAAGISMFVASGDQGAYDCQQDDLTDHRLSVDWPAASPDAVAVGGTRLYLGAGASYLGEAGWEEQLSAGGGGGGFSVAERRPRWQSARGIGAPGAHRGLPDVSANADLGTPWSYYSAGELGEVGGTSASAPFWAAAMALIDQYTESHGVGRVGRPDPIFYALASSRQPFPPFHDVTRGGNRYYQAGPGWDPATGLGSPDVYNLARDIVAYLRVHPATARRQRR